MKRTLLLTVLGGALLMGCKQEPAVEAEPVVDAAPKDVNSGPLVCPTDAFGAKLVLMKTPGGHQYCIDQREVLKSEYASFLEAKKGDVSGQPPECAFNTRFDPKPYEPGPPQAGVCPIGAFDLDVNPDHPVLCVDFCDALMFCGWAGKRLCSMPGVKPGTVHTVKQEDLASTIGSDENEWRNACSQGGKTKFPYGDEYVPGACIDVPRVSSEGEQALAGKAPEAETCHGAEPPYDEVFHLSGSVSEWVNVCEGSCAISGGSWSQLGSVEDVNAFACDGTHSASRATVDPYNGIRCCADAVAAP